MKPVRAKQVLLACRPELDRQDPDVAAALALAEHDLELGGWWREQQEVRTALRDEFRRLPVPAELKDQLLAEVRIVRPVFWRSNAARWAAVAAVLVLILGVRVWRPANNLDGQTLAQFRDRMVRTVVREYRMDITSSSETQIRGYLSQARGHSDFRLPGGVATVPFFGAGHLSWRGHPVSMVCFQRQAGVLMYLFVVDRSAVSKPPGERPEFDTIVERATASWSEGEMVYVLASDAGLSDLRSLLR